ncbi:hypothetical protein DB30_00123 [Enhygromyxa salina]|uniref:DUF1795 domain-containing protein n=1 Tax=Enhygromyxa salina TaxID=215803 RepID=A0A0C1ZPR7_9BACT|nr:hypothetical protein [Enhygromyxa salina]KIG19614.1 hypothetical protein DB30_00123 [Enhygromyxa salina]
MLAALLDPETGIELIEPAPGNPQHGRVELPNAGCSIIPPPGFVFVSREVMPMAPSLASFVRVGIEPEPDAMVDVWRVDESVQDAGQLRAFADQTARGWANEGAQDVEVESRALADAPHAAAVRCEISFTVQGRSRRCLCCWFIAADNAVTRIAVSFPGQVPFVEWESLLSAVVNSWQPLKPTEPEPSARGPWWRRLVSR